MHFVKLIWEEKIKEKSMTLVVAVFKIPCVCVRVHVQSLTNLLFFFFLHFVYKEKCVKKRSLFDMVLSLNLTSTALSLRL